MENYSVKDAISQRKSVRTYDGAPLRAEDIQKLEQYAQSLQNPFGVPVTFRILDAKEQKLTSPVIVGAGTYLGAKVPRVSHAEIALGMILRNLFCTPNLLASARSGLRRPSTARHSSGPWRYRKARSCRL